MSTSGKRYSFSIISNGGIITDVLSEVESDWSPWRCTASLTMSVGVRLHVSCDKVMWCLAPPAVRVHSCGDHFSESEARLKSGGRQCNCPTVCGVLFPGPAISRDPTVPKETSAWTQRLLQLQQWWTTTFILISMQYQLFWVFCFSIYGSILNLMVESCEVGASIRTSLNFLLTSFRVYTSNLLKPP